MNVVEQNRDKRASTSVRKQPRGPAIGTTDLGSLDIYTLSRQAKLLYSVGAWAIGTYALCGTGYLIQSNKTYACVFLLISASCCACMAFWNSQNPGGVPTLPVFAIQIALLNSISLLTGNEMFEGLPDYILIDSALTIALFLLVLCGGWWIGMRLVRAAPSVWNITEGGSAVEGQFGLNAALPLLLIGIVFQASMINGIIFTLLSGQDITLLPVIWAFAGAASSLGAFLGGLAVAKHPFRPGSILFWAAFAVTFFLFVSGLLLSGASALVLSCAVGLGFGARRIPWGFLVIALLVVGFLNEGKFVMRARYLDPESGAPSVQLTTLPQYYVEWAGDSISKIQDMIAGKQAVEETDEQGQSITDRLGSFQNLTFVVNVLNGGVVQPLYGETYTVIPSLLIPRFLWPEKPRTHEGQVMLNLHFGRQTDVEATLTTYVAWGLLPEAVGNFGCMGGACFLGLVGGLACGAVEKWSARKRLFSVEGLAAAALLVQLAGSYEYVASVFVTSTFQLVVAIIVFGFLLRFQFMRLQRLAKGRLSSGKRTRPVNN